MYFLIVKLQGLPRFQLTSETPITAYPFLQNGAVFGGLRVETDALGNHYQYLDAIITEPTPLRIEYVKTRTKFFMVEFQFFQKLCSFTTAASQLQQPQSTNFQTLPVPPTSTFVSTPKTGFINPEMAASPPSTSGETSEVEEIGSQINTDTRVVVRATPAQTPVPAKTNPPPMPPQFPADYIPTSKPLNKPAEKPADDSMSITEPAANNPTEIQDTQEPAAKIQAIATDTIPANESIGTFGQQQVEPVDPVVAEFDRRAIEVTDDEWNVLERAFCPEYVADYKYGPEYTYIGKISTREPVKGYAKVDGPRVFGEHFKECPILESLGIKTRRIVISGQENACYSIQVTFKPEMSRGMVFSDESAVDIARMIMKLHYNKFIKTTAIRAIAALRTRK